MRWRFLVLKFTWMKLRVVCARVVDRLFGLVTRICPFEQAWTNITWLTWVRFYTIIWIRLRWTMRFSPIYISWTHLSTQICCRCRQSVLWISDEKVRVGRLVVDILRLFLIYCRVRGNTYWFFYTIVWWRRFAGLVAVFDIHDILNLLLSIRVSLGWLFRVEFLRFFRLLWLLRLFLWIFTYRFVWLLK